MANPKAFDCSNCVFRHTLRLDIHCQIHDHLPLFECTRHFPDPATRGIQGKIMVASERGIEGVLEK